MDSMWIGSILKVAKTRKTMYFCSKVSISIFLAAYKNLIIFSFNFYQELREAFEAEAQERKMPRLLLTAAVPVGPDNVKGGYDVPAVAR